MHARTRVIHNTGTILTSSSSGILPLGGSTTAATTIPPSPSPSSTGRLIPGSDGVDHDKKNGGRIGSKYTSLAPYRLTVLSVSITLWLLFVPIIVRRAGGETAKNTGSNTMSKSISPNKNEEKILPPGFDSIYKRAVGMSQACERLCHTINSKGSSNPIDKNNAVFPGFDIRSELPFLNDTVASLPSFGIISALEQFNFQREKTTVLRDQQQQQQEQQCKVPPAMECNETQFTVVFMAYNPDRLGKTMAQIKTMMKLPYSEMVKEIVLVWNGPRDVNESSSGIALLMYSESNPVRIVYPLKMGFPNDLMNRYEPSVVNVTTKAILYYDDDGPFYSYKAIRGGFELWKRHSNVQIGAMSREITYSLRQQKEWNILTNDSISLTDKAFVSHCAYNNNTSSSSSITTSIVQSDQVDYNYRYFANYNANMVLPSGSFLHSYYLCFVCHPVFTEVRKFVQDHPVHPDDMTVSMIVSQLAGAAPRVYSRTLADPDPDPVQTTTALAEVQSRRKRRLESVDEPNHSVEEVHVDDDWDQIQYSKSDNSRISSKRSFNHGTISLKQKHRRLMFKIDWDAGSGMTEMKRYWADLRIEAINSLVRYFGSLNSGSIGWCEGTKYFDPNKREGKCTPVMARLGWLPWMNPDGTPRESCP